MILGQGRCERICNHEDRGKRRDQEGRGRGEVGGAMRGDSGGQSASLGQRAGCKGRTRRLREPLPDFNHFPDPFQVFPDFGEKTPQK